MQLALDAGPQFLAAGQRDVAGEHDQLGVEQGGDTGQTGGEAERHLPEGGACPLDDRLRALVAATQEAIVNAARHSGAPVVAVYEEVEPDQVTVFVRDRGRGFDPTAVPSDRRGVAESIVGRLSRNGGDAVINSQPGEGTEVQLVLRRSAA